MGPGSIPRTLSQLNGDWSKPGFEGLEMPRTIEGYIDIHAERGVKKSPNGLTYALLGSGKASYQLPGIGFADTDALANEVLRRYRDGVVLDVVTQISHICNWAHANGVEARDLLRAISARVEKLGVQATKYQVHTRENVDEALRRLDEESPVGGK